jgi:RND superfamily putative drug exporter
MLERAFDRLARLIHRHRYLVLVICLFLGVLGGWGALGVQNALYGSTLEITGTPSYQVARALRKDFDNPFAELAVVTVKSPGHTLDEPGYQAAVAEIEAALRATPEVKKVLGPADRKDARLRSADGHIGMILVGLAAATVQEGEKAVPKLRAAIKPAGEHARAADPGFQWATTGRGALSYDISQYGAKDTAAAEARVIPFTFAILFLAFGALVAGTLPLAMGLLTTVITLGLIAAIAHHVALGAMVQNMSTMVGLAVGIDYSLIMVGRFREGLARGLGTEEALAECMRTAGVAVACSGVTVMIGLSGLGLTPAMDTRSIGLGGALVLVVGVTLALTLLPALLSILGPLVDAPKALGRWLRPYNRDEVWRRWARWVMQRPVPLALAGFALLALMSAPLLKIDMEFTGSRWIPSHELEFHTGFDMLEEMGKKNASTPIDLLVTSKQGPILEGPGLEGLLAVSAALHQEPRILSVAGPVDVKPGLDYHKLYKHWKAVRGLDPALFDAFVSRDGKSALIQVVAKDQVTYEGIKTLARELAKRPAPAGVEVVIGGQAAFYNDLYDALIASLPGMVAFVVGATFLLLALTYRSWLVPLKATILNLLSVGAGCGALVMIFQWGWARQLVGLTEVPGGVPLGVLVMIFCVVFGLSMDYEVFLLSRIKERYDAHGDNARATEEGLAATGGIITSAALIMVTVFGGFALAKLVLVQMSGVGLGVAVLVDATVVRVLLAPALMRLAGDWNWHPGAQRRSSSASSSAEAGASPSAEAGASSSPSP